MIGDPIARARELDKAATPGPWPARFIFRVIHAVRRHARRFGLAFGTHGDTDWADSQFCAESRTILPALADALETERKALAQLEQELATSRAAHEVTALERDRATTELAIMRAWVEQARPVVEAVQDTQTAYQRDESDMPMHERYIACIEFLAKKNKLLTMPLPSAPKEPK